MLYPYLENVLATFVNILCFWRTKDEWIVLQVALASS